MSVHQWLGNRWIPRTEPVDAVIEHILKNNDAQIASSAPFIHQGLILQRKGYHSSSFKENVNSDLKGSNEASISHQEDLKRHQAEWKELFDSSRHDTKELRISGLGGSLCTIDAHISWTISEVKDKIAELMHIPKYKQCLLLDLDELENTYMVRELTGDPFVQLSLVRRSIEAFLKHPQSPSSSDVPEAAETPAVGRVRYAALASFLPRENDEVCIDRKRTVSTCESYITVRKATSESRVRHTALQPRLESVDVALKAVKRDGMMLQHAQSWIQDDRNVVLTAVRQNGLALEYAAPALKDDHAIVLEAMASDVGAHRLASDRIKKQFQILSDWSDNYIEVERLGACMRTTRVIPKWRLSAVVASQLLRESLDLS